MQSLGKTTLVSLDKTQATCIITKQYVFSLQEFNDLHGRALRVISNCLEDGESMQLIQGLGGLEQLLQFVVTPTLSEVQANAVKAIARVAENGTKTHTQFPLIRLDY